MSTYGTNKIKQVFYGRDKIGRIYYGTNLVFRTKTLVSRIDFDESIKFADISTNLITPFLVSQKQEYTLINDTPITVLSSMDSGSGYTKAQMTAVPATDPYGNSKVYLDNKNYSVTFDKSGGRDYKIVLSLDSMNYGTEYQFSTIKIVSNDPRQSRKDEPMFTADKGTVYWDADSHTTMWQCDDSQLVEQTEVTFTISGPSAAQWNTHLRVYEIDFTYEADTEKTFYTVTDGATILQHIKEDFPDYKTRAKDGILDFKVGDPPIRIDGITTLRTTHANGETIDVKPRLQMMDKMFDIWSHDETPFTGYYVFEAPYGYNFHSIEFFGVAEKDAKHFLPYNGTQGFGHLEYNKDSFVWVQEQYRNSNEVQFNWESGYGNYGFYNISKIKIKYKHSTII